MMTSVIPSQLQSRIGHGVRLVCAGACFVLLVLLVVRMIGNAETGFSKSNLAVFAGLVSVLVLLLLPGAFFAGVRRRLAALLFGVLIAAGILETYIRVFDPFPILLRGGRIDLPVHAKKQFSSNQLPGLDATVTVTYNSLGFRGPEPPTNWDDQLTIICVGGSTTQCLYLSDGTTWPDRLAARLSEDDSRVWVNNAGIDGHSSFGHLELLDQYLVALQPKVLLFLVGLNDVDREDLSHYDASTLRGLARSDDSIARTLQRLLLRNSDAFALLDNFRLQWSARRKGLTHGEPIGHRRLTADNVKQPLSMEARSQWLTQRDPQCLAGYKARLMEIVQRCERAKIECILITQPVLYGVGTDDVTGIDLECVPVNDVDGWTHWRLLQQYNLVTLQVGDERKVAVIDLANQLPKSSKYFYDLTHFNKEGAMAVAEIIHRELKFGTQR